MFTSRRIAAAGRGAHSHADCGPDRQADDPAAAEHAVINYAPLKRMATPGEIAAAILFLASDHSRFVTGAAFQIDGGSTAGQC